MSDSDDTVETAYGRLDRAALRQAQHTYDTTILLRMVDDLDAMLAEARAEDGLRDMLLRLHGMAHTVINGAGMTVATGGKFAGIGVRYTGRSAENRHDAARLAPTDRSAGATDTAQLTA